MRDEQVVSVTASLAFELLAQRSPVAADVVRLFSFLHADNIPWELITQGAEALGPEVTNMVGNAGLDAVYDLLLDPKRLLLVSVNQNEQFSSIFPWVQSTIHNGMSSDQRRSWTEKSVRVLRKALPVGDVSDTQPRFDRLIPHAHAVARHVGKDIETDDSAFLLNKVGSYLYERGRYQEAESFARQGVDVWERLPDPDKFLFAGALTTVGAICRANAQYTEAFPMFSRALELRKQCFGPINRFAVESLNDLALTYHLAGQFEDAEQTYTECLAMNEDLHGRRHLYTAAPMQGLASLYTDLQRLEEAEELHKRSHEIYKSYYGPEDRHVAKSHYEMARFFHACARYQDAEEHYGRSVEIFSITLGPDHPWLVDPLHYFSELSLDQRQFDRAKEFCERAQRICERSFSPRHPTAMRGRELQQRLQEQAG